jgi:hypothetical protein
LKRCDDLVVRGASIWIGVEPYGALEEERMLRNRDNPTADLLSREGRNVHPIHADGASVQVDEAEEAQDEGRLATARSAANPNLLPRLDGDGNIPQDKLIRAVS